MQPPPTARRGSYTQACHACCCDAASSTVPTAIPLFACRSTSSPLREQTHYGTDSTATTTTNRNWCKHATMMLHSAQSGSSRHPCNQGAAVPTAAATHATPSAPHPRMPSRLALVFALVIIYTLCHLPHLQKSTRAQAQNCVSSYEKNVWYCISSSRNCYTQQAAGTGRSSAHSALTSTLCC
jgi:hypothetical protein